MFAQAQDVVRIVPMGDGGDAAPRRGPPPQHLRDRPGPRRPHTAADQHEPDEKAMAK